MKYLVAVSLLIFGALALTPINHDLADRKQMYTRTGVPPKSDWRVLKEADQMHVVTFTLALKQRNLDKLEEFFWDNSNPKSPNFAKHMTRGQVTELISPTRAVQRQVLNWIYDGASTLGSHHLIQVENRGDAIVVKATVKLVEKLLSTKMYLFHNDRKNWVMAKHLGPISVPMHLSEHIEMITGITELPPSRLPFIWDRDDFKEKTAAKQNADNQCNVPYTIKTQYNVDLSLTVTNPNANASIYAEGSQGSPEGFGLGSDKYWEQANGIPNNPITCILGNGASNFVPNDTDDEALLDTQMITGMAVGAKTCFYIMDAGSGWMYEFGNQIFITPNAPLVVSMSYGWVEFEQCINETDGTYFLGNCTYLHIPDSKVYVNRTNVEFMKLGSLGHTLLAASGDDGVCGTHGSPNGCTAQGPIFPAASPYVVTVGATSIEQSTSTSGKNDLAGSPPICSGQQYQCECTTSTNEQIGSQDNTAGFDTGGGFSVYSPQPAYQTQAVQAYLKSGVQLPSSSVGWNPNNRGFPDIGAIGENFCCLDPGSSCELLAGTSASCPLIASLVTLLNNDRLNAGKSPLGFFNPIIYDMFDSNPSKYFSNQFTQQTNGGECGTQFGFYSQPGFWSPLVGCGSPKFDQIKAYVDALP